MVVEQKFFFSEDDNDFLISAMDPKFKVITRSEEDTMFESIEEKIKQKYKRQEEYLIDRYPENYFDYYIDIGARGCSSPWHINNIAKANPETICVGYEPDLPYYKELADEVKKVNNLRMYPYGFSYGKSIPIPAGNAKGISLENIILDNDIDIDSRWSIKFDCEGCEYSLLREESCVDILNKASHMALEFHNKKMGGNFFKNKYDLRDTFKDCEQWMNDNFSDSHSIFLTSKGFFGKRGDEVEGLRTYVLISQEIMDEKDNLFWRNLL